MVAIVVAANLGKEFDFGTVVPEKISLKIAPNGLTRLPDGTIAFDPTSIDASQIVQGNETVTSLTYEPTTSTLTFTNEAGSVSSIDLSALTTDLFVQGGEFDPTALALTLKNVDTAQPDVVVPLASLKLTEHLASPTVALSGTGEAATPLKADVIVDPAPTNILKALPTGLAVDSSAIAPPLNMSITDAFGVPLFAAGVAA